MPTPPAGAPLVGHCLDFGDSALPYLPFTELFGRLDRARRRRRPVALAEAHPALSRPAARPPTALRRAPPTPARRASTAPSCSRPCTARSTTSPPTQPLLVVRRGRPLGRPAPPATCSASCSPARSASPWPSSSPTAATTCTVATRSAPPSPSGCASPACSRLPLPPLDRRRRAHARALAARRRPAEREDLSASSTGPRATRSSPRSWSPRPSWASQGLPDDLADLLLVRLDRLDDAARSVVRAAVGRRPPGLPRAARRGRRPRRRRRSSARCAPPSSRTSSSGSAPTATRSGTRCSPRRSTTTCCPASGCACTRRTPRRCGSQARRRHRRRARPARPRRPRPRHRGAGQHRRRATRRCRSAVPTRPPSTTRRLSSCWPTRAARCPTTSTWSALVMRTSDAVIASGHPAAGPQARAATSSAASRRTRPPTTGRVC